MQGTRWIILTVLVSVLVAAATTWCMVNSVSQKPSTEPKSVRPGLTAAELLQQARHMLRSAPSNAEDTTQQERVEMFLEMAAARQAEHPAEIPAAWEQMKQLFEDQPIGQGELVKANPAGLLLCLDYDETLDHAALSCNSQEDLELLWLVRSQVTQEITRLRGELATQLQDQLNYHAEHAEDGKTVEQVASFAVLKHSLDAPLLALVATMSSPEPDEQLRDILAHADRYAQQASHEIASLNAKVEKLDARLHQLDEPIDPVRQEVQQSSSFMPGPCEKLLQQLQELETVLAVADLSSWQVIGAKLDQDQVGGSGETPAPTFSPEKQSEEWNLLASKLYGLQQLAYNLWALREIQSAGEIVDNWDVRLGPIDPGLLHLTVAALYSRTYDDRIAEPRRPEERSAKARNVLLTAKVGLSAF